MRLTQRGKIVPPEAWTKYEAFPPAHSRPGDNKPLYLDHRQFERFEAGQTVGHAGLRHDAYVQVAGVREPPSRCALYGGDAIDTLRLEQKFQFQVSGEKSGGSHGSNNALPEMRKTNGPGSH